MFSLHWRIGGADDVIHGAGYGSAGVSGHVAAGAMALGDINGLMRKLYSEALEKFVSKIVALQKLQPYC